MIKASTHKTQLKNVVLALLVAVGLASCGHPADADLPPQAPQNREQVAEGTTLQPQARQCWNATEHRWTACRQGSVQKR